VRGFEPPAPASRKQSGPNPFRQLCQALPPASARSVPGWCQPRNSRMGASCPAGRRCTYLSTSATEDLASAENRRRAGPAQAKGSAGQPMRTPARQATARKVRSGRRWSRRSLTTAVPFAVGPQVRIRLPPAASLVRTCISPAHIRVGPRSGTAAVPARRAVAPAILRAPTTN